jgi:recombination protein RecA
MERLAPVLDLAQQVEARVKRPFTRRPVFAGSDHVISTGSTLLDLAISGSRFPQGGIPGGILVEIFGPSSCGKTVMLCEIAGVVQRKGGGVLFKDPEARLNSQFAQLFGFRIEDADYTQPDTVPELFEPVRKWQPETENGVINGIFADSLAALSTKMEMDDKDQYGMRRAKEFSEECRKTCRILTQRNFLMVCSNQVRQNIDVNPFAEKYTSPGGVSIGFYASLRLRCHSPKKISIERDVGKNKVKRVAGVETLVEVYKSSVDVPFRSAPLFIMYDYGVDDIRANLIYIKTMTGSSSYNMGERRLGAALDRAIKVVEEESLEEELKDKTIQLWNEVEEKFKVSRVPKRRE